MSYLVDYVLVFSPPFGSYDDDKSVREREAFMASTTAYLNELPPLQDCDRTVHAVRTLLTRLSENPQRHVMTGLRGSLLTIGGTGNYTNPEVFVEHLRSWVAQGPRRDIMTCVSGMTLFWREEAAETWRIIQVA